MPSLLYRLSGYLMHKYECHKELFRRKHPSLQRFFYNCNNISLKDEPALKRHILTGSYRFPYEANSFVLESSPRKYVATRVAFRNGDQVLRIGLFNGLFLVDYAMSGSIDDLKDGYVSIETLAEFYKAIARNTGARNQGPCLKSMTDKWGKSTMGIGRHDRGAIGGDRDILRWLKASYEYLTEAEGACDEAKLVFASVLVMYKMTSPLVPEMEVQLGCSSDGLFLAIGAGDTEKRVTVELWDVVNRFDPGVCVLAGFPSADHKTEYCDLDLNSDEVQHRIRESRRWCRSSAEFHDLRKIAWHEEGAQTNRTTWETVLVWVYTIAAVSLSIATPSLNLMNRDNVTERLVDGFTVASILLVSFFGFIKLTSEDPNAVQNRLVGIKVFKSMHEVCRFCNVTQAMAKLLLDANDEPARWVSNHNTCALDITCAGSIQFERGCSSTEILGMGKMLLYDMETGDMRLFDAVRERCRRVRWRSASIVHVGEDIWYGGEPGLKDVVVRGDIVLEGKS